MQKVIPIYLIIVAITCGACGQTMNESTQDRFSADDAARFAQLAVSCIPQEYPNKLNQLLQDESDLRTPRQLHPAFYGCYDWHSSVHGHWMLVKVLREFPELPDRDAIAAQLYNSISPDNIAAEVAYFERESKSWERMYGWAWLLQLQTELNTWDEPLGQELSTVLQPLTDHIRGLYLEFLPIQTYPVRTGVHPNTAFGMSFAHDYAVQTEDAEFAKLLEDTALRYFGDDEQCPIFWEPSGEDFLSPCLEEAALMSRVMPANEFQRWLAAFLPQLDDLSEFQPADVSDRADPKIAHLDGLNLSRAWDLFIIANNIDDEDTAEALRAKADEHLDASLSHVTGEHYVGSHWLGSFAIYALTRER